MKTKFNFLLSITCGFVCSSCSTTSAQRITTVDMMTPAANFSVVNGDTLLTCNVSQLKDTLFASFSDICIQAGILEPMEYVILEDRPEALVSNHSRIAMSENYILVFGEEQVPHKVFNHQGKLLGSIGPLPRSEDDKPIIIQASIDEVHKRVFFLTHIPPYLLSYAFDGSDLRTHYSADHGRPHNFILHPERSTLTVTSNSVHRKGSYLIWEQDWEGNVLDSLPYRNTYFPQLQEELNKKEGERVYLNTNQHCNTTAIDLSFIWQTKYTKGDTLYNYNKEQQRFIPRFALTWDPNKEYFIREMIELPRHYAGSVSEKLADGENRELKDRHPGESSHSSGVWISSSDGSSKKAHQQIGGNTQYLIEKATGKAAVLRSWYGEFTPQWVSINCRDGYYAVLDSKRYAISTIDDELKRNIPQERREKLMRIKEQLSGTNNLCVRFAKVKP